MPTNGANSELLLLSLVWASCKDHTKSTTCKRESGEKEPESNVKTPAEMPTTLYLFMCPLQEKNTWTYRRGGTMVWGCFANSETQRQRPTQGNTQRRKLMF